MSKRTQMTRRNLLKAAAATSTALAFPTIIPSSALGDDKTPAPSERLTLGFVGIGKQASGHLGNYLGRSDCQVVAVSDVDTVRRELAKDRTNKKYSELNRAGYKGCDAYNDYRELLARKDIDAVVIGVPDHWHAAIALEAAKNKKDIYCEKPLTLTIEEAHKLVEGVRKHERVFQTGSQQRSSGPFRQAVEYIRNGRIGKIKEVHVGIGVTSRPYDLKEEAIPKGLDWEKWLGQAPKLPYNDGAARGGKTPDAYPFNPGWRDFREFSGGYVTDWGAHHFDITQWALDMDESGPVEIIPPEKPDDKYGAKFIYRGSPVGDEITVTHVNVVYEGTETKDGKSKTVKETNGITFIGDKGKIFVSRSKIISEPDGILKEPLKDSDKQVYRSSNHHTNWTDCIKTRKKPICDVEVGARSVTVCHLVNLAYWNQKKLQWDPKKWEFTGANAEEANKWRSRARRSGYELPEA